MSLTAISSLESARRKFLINSTQNMCKNLESARRKFFMISSQNMCKNLESHVFGLRSQNESNSHQLARIGQMKIFHELDAEHV